MRTLESQMDPMGGLLEDAGAYADHVATMQCAGEDGFSRTFWVDANGDAVCTECGWYQSSYEAGMNELLLCATWHPAGLGFYAMWRSYLLGRGFADIPESPTYFER